MTDRPSRQDLVVSTQTSNLRFALTAAGCACAGFGLVWAGLAVRGMLSGGAAPTTPDVRQVVAAPADFPPSSDQLTLPSDSAPATRFTERPVEPTSYGEAGDNAPAPAGRYADRGRFGQAALPAAPRGHDRTFRGRRF